MCIRDSGLLPPRSFFNPRSRENFLSDTGITFDYLGIANSLSENFIRMLLHPERANRLVTQYGFDSNLLSLEETLKAENILSYTKQATGDKYLIKPDS